MAENWVKKSQGSIASFKKKGDSFAGILIGVKQEKGKFKKKLNVYTASDLESEESKTFFSGAVIDRLMVQVKPDDKFKLIFTGLTKSKAGRKVKTFDLFMAE